jgi:hypothetical protein
MDAGVGASPNNTGVFKNSISGKLEHFSYFQETFQLDLNLKMLCLQNHD